MANEDVVIESEAAAQPDPESAQAKTAPRRPKTQKTLPTDRIAFTKQLDVLRAYGQLGAEGKSVTNADVANIVQLHFNTTSLANAFLIEAGLLRREADGQVPAQDVINYARAYEWNAETAGWKLRPTLAASWFGQALLPKLRFRSHTKQEALAVLAEVSGASSNHRGQLETVLEYMVTGGLVEKDGDTIKIVRGTDSGSSQQETTMPDVKTTQPSPAVTSAPAPATPSPGQITFNVNLSVTMAEISALTPDKITAFFAGIADVMKIQSEIEAIRKGS